MVWGSLAAGFACLAIFLVVETRAASPMVPLSLFASPDFAGANLLTLFVYAGLGIFFFLFPLNLIQVQGYSATASGAAALPFILLMFLLSRWSGGLVAHYGARLPLIVGPLIVAAGFALFLIPAVGGSYWRTFFVPVVVLGLGMAVTVAPLTTTVMNSAGQERAGAASGINNAVARVAGVLSIAVLGVVMFSAFSYRLNHELGGLNIPNGAKQQIVANEIKLAGMPLPGGLDDNMTAGLKRAIGGAFLFGFRIFMLGCAGLALAGAATAWWMIPKPALPARK